MVYTLTGLRGNDDDQALDTIIGFVCLFVWLVDLVGWFLNVLVNYEVISRTGPKTKRLTILHMAQSWETMTSASAGHIILTPTQPVGSWRP